MIVDKTFCQSMDGNFGRSIACREGSSCPELSIYSRKNKTAPSMMERVQSNKPIIRLITQRNGIILEPQCWSLLLADWAFSSGHSQVTFGEWKSMLLSTCITSISVTMPLCS